ncbi:MAG: catalase [Catenulispora sp.]
MTEDPGPQPPPAGSVLSAGGAGAHGYFEPYEPLAKYTCADFLREPGRPVPVFARFSTGAGHRGSADTVRDVRGFAVKFYTREGHYDLVGSNIPVSFLRDEPHPEIPTGVSAPDTFWDFCSSQTETTHMLMWLMSDWAIPRSYRMMPGFGVRTFRFVAADGSPTLARFHWRPELGASCLVRTEAQTIAEHDPDFHRRDLWTAIAAGDHPAWELGVQLIRPEEADAFGYDLLDPTKLVPEETVPVRPIGRMVLDRNPGDFSAGAEQVPFDAGNLVPGIEFGPMARRDGRTVGDHFGQASMFWHSMADWERRHITDAFGSELARVRAIAVRERMIGNLARVAPEPAAAVADRLGLPAPEPPPPTWCPPPSPALSLARLGGGDPATGTVALLAADGVDTDRALALRGVFERARVRVDVVAPRAGVLDGRGPGTALVVDRALATTSSALYDAVLVPGGAASAATLGRDERARRFVREAFDHGKPIGLLDCGGGLLPEGAAQRYLMPVAHTTPDDPAEVLARDGIVATVTGGDRLDGFTEAFAAALAARRFPDRPPPGGH